MQVTNNSTELILYRLKQSDRDVLVELYKENEAMIVKYIREQNGRTEDAVELIKRDKFAQRVYDDNFRTNILDLS